MSQPAQPPARSVWLSLIVLCAGQMMIVIDQNIVNVALPTVQSSLGFSPANLVWVVNAYVIPFGGLLLLAGRFGDLIGRKSIFMVATTFYDSRGQARAIGAYSFASAGGGAFGPLLGGVLTDLVNGNWIFFINAPIGAVVVLLGLRSVPKDTGAGLREGAADYLGAVLVTAGLMLFVFTIVNAENVGWDSTGTLILGPVAILLLIGFVVREATAAQPLLPLKIFRTRSLTAANIVQFLIIAGLFGLLYYGTLYLQRVLRYDSLAAGLGFVPIAVVIAAISLGLSARLIIRFGVRPILFLGIVLIIVAFVLLSFAHVDGTYAADFLPAGLVMGGGFGLAAPAMMGLGMAAVTPSESGIASGLFNTTQQIGGAIGLTVLSAFVAARTNGLTTSGAGETASLVGGYHVAFRLAAAFVFAGLVIAAAMLRTKPAAAERTQSSPHQPEQDVTVSSCRAS